MAVFYEFGKPKTDFGSIVAYRAVVSRLLGVDQGGELLPKKTGILLGAWRKRLNQLRMPPGRPIERQYRARDCGPAFIQVTPRPNYCYRDTVCPFCYARRVSRLARRIRQALRQAYASGVIPVLALQQQQLLLPYSPGHKDALKNSRQVTWQDGDELAEVKAAYQKICDEFSEPRYWRKAYQQLGPDVLGAVFMCLVEPGQSGWVVTLRKAVILPEGGSVRWPALRGRRLQAAVKRGIYRNPVRAKLSQVLVRLYAYPCGWLRWPKLCKLPDAAADTPPGEVAAEVSQVRLLPLEVALAADRLRLSGLYGNCRNNQVK